MTYERRPAGSTAELARSAKTSTAKNRREAVLAEAAEDDAEVIELPEGRVEIRRRAAKKKKARAAK